MENNSGNRGPRVYNSYGEADVPRFDPDTGEPLRCDYEPAYEDQPRFDPDTGEPLYTTELHGQNDRQPHYDYEPAYEDQPRFDPETGEPLYTTELHGQNDRQPRFDPETGEPLYTTEMHGRNDRQPRFDPETGAPLQQNAIRQQQKRRDGSIDFEDSFEKKPPKKKKNTLFIVLMITLTVILLAGIGVIVYFLFFNKPNEPEEDTTAQAQAAWPDSIVDEWVVTQKEINGSPINFGDEEYKIAFRSDKKAEMFGNGRKTSTGAYKIEGNNVTIIWESGNMSGTYDPSKDTMILSSVDNNNVIKYTVERASKVSAPQPTTPSQQTDPGPQNTDAQNTIVDKWTVTQMKQGSQVMTRDQFPNDIFFLFRADGTMENQAGGESLSGPYQINGNQIGFTLDGVQVSGSYDPATDTITLEIEGSQVTLDRASKVSASQPTTPGVQVDPGPGASQAQDGENIVIQSPDDGTPPPSAPASPDTQVEYKFPDAGVPNDTVRQYARNYVVGSGTTFYCNDIIHEIEKDSLTDYVSMTLVEERSDGTYTSDLTMVFRFSPSSGSWSMINKFQSDPMREETDTEPSYTDQTSFTFGGETIEANTTEINGADLGINGTKNNYRRITKKEVENLVEMCPDLKKLQLEYCYLDDYKPLSKLTELEVLDLKNCGNLTGDGEQIEDISWISSLKKLKQIRMNGNAINDLTPLENMKNLKLINFSDNALDNDSVKSIAKIESLEDVNLYYNAISDFSPLVSLKNLRYLNIHHTNIKSIDFLSKMESKNLKTLYIGMNYDKKPLPYFDWVSAIVTLYYHINEGVSSSSDYTKITVNVEIKDENVYDQIKLLDEYEYVVIKPQG